MATGLIALLDDVASLAKVAYASLDDAATQAAKAGSKAVGVVIDDTAVTPRYVVGFQPGRELPIVFRIAMGSLRNKMLFLLPAALALSLLAPWAITPLLMLGGAYLCYEGAEKLYHAVAPHPDAHHAAETVEVLDAKAFEDEKVAAAVRTDFILSAEIMAITLAGVAASPFVTQAVILAVVGLGITLLVYGTVALIVKADDAGLALLAATRPVSGLFGRGGAAAPPTAADRALLPVARGVGRALVVVMPLVLKLLSVVGTAAMLWVGGGIVIHGLEEYGRAEIGHAVHHAGEAAAHAVPGAVAPVVEWAVGAAIAGVFGLLLGLALIPLASRVIEPLWARLRRKRAA